MKKLVLVVGVLLFSIGVGSAAQKPKTQTYTGEIMDNMCAMLGGHSQMKMPGESARQCTLRCVKMGGKFVLFNPQTKKYYNLDDQKKPAAFAGEKVKVTGVLDSETRTIHVVKIQAGS